MQYCLKCENVSLNLLTKYALNFDDYELDNFVRSKPRLNDPTFDTWIFALKERCLTLHSIIYFFLPKKKMSFTFCGANWLQSYYSGWEGWAYGPITQSEDENISENYQ